MADSDDLLVAFELHSVTQIQTILDYDNVKVLLAAAGRPVPPLDNVPNRYLKSAS